MLIPQAPAILTENDSQELKKVFEKLPPVSKCVELGSFKGHNSFILASLLGQNNTLYCISNFYFSYDNFQEFRQNTQKFVKNRSLRFLVMETIEAAKDFENQVLQLVLINSVFSPSVVQQQITLWYPKVKLGGYFIYFKKSDSGEITSLIKKLNLSQIELSECVLCKKITG